MSVMVMLMCVMLRTHLIHSGFIVTVNITHVEGHVISVALDTTNYLGNRLQQTVQTNVNPAIVMVMHLNVYTTMWYTSNNGV